MDCAKGNVLTVVFVHGFPDTYRMWDQIIAASGRDDCVALDLPGFSSAAPDGWPSTVDAYVAWILAEVERRVAVGGPVHLVGHDWGCIMGLRAASLRPELFRSVAGGNGPIDENWPLHTHWKLWAQPGTGEAAMAAMNVDDLPPGLVHMGMTPEGARTNSLTTPGHKAVALTLYRSGVNVGRDWAADLARIVVPSMLIWGVRDMDVPVETGRRMAWRMGAEMVELDAHHFWPYAKPVEATQALQRLWAHAEREPTTILTRTP